MMGCDIHAHVEVKKHNEWHYYGQAKIKRNYDLFAKMADVRNYEKIKPIAGKRGLPDDASLMTRFHSAHYGTDGHSHSWVSFNEILSILEFGKQFSIPPWELCPKFGIWIFGNDISFFSEYPEEYPIDDIRLVFWFDN